MKLWIKSGITIGTGYYNLFFCCCIGHKQNSELFYAAHYLPLFVRGTIAQFNLQLRPLFELLQILEGVQLAPHLCEPDINKFIAMDKGQLDGGCC